MLFFCTLWGSLDHGIISGSGGDFHAEAELVVFDDIMMSTNYLG